MQAASSAVRISPLGALTCTLQILSGASIRTLRSRERLGRGGGRAAGAACTAGAAAAGALAGAAAGAGTAAGAARGAAGAETPGGGAGVLDGVKIWFFVASALLAAPLRAKPRLSAAAAKTALIAVEVLLLLLIRKRNIPSRPSPYSVFTLPLSS